MNVSVNVLLTDSVYPIRDMDAHDEDTVQLAVAVPAEVIRCNAPYKRYGNIDWNRNRVREAGIFFQSEIFKGDFHAIVALVSDDYGNPSC